MLQLIKVEGNNWLGGLLALNRLTIVLPKLLLLEDVLLLLDVLLLIHIHSSILRKLVLQLLLDRIHLVVERVVASVD